MCVYVYIYICNTVSYLLPSPQSAPKVLGVPRGGAPLGRAGFVWGTAKKPIYFSERLEKNIYTHIYIYIYIHIYIYMILICLFIHRPRGRAPANPRGRGVFKTLRQKELFQL